MKRVFRIAYIGGASGTSLHRAMAMRRLGHDVTVIDPMMFLPASKWTSRWLHHLGGLGVGIVINGPITKAVNKLRPEIIWVNQGDFLGKKLLLGFGKMSVPIINYTNDDPFGGRDGRRFNHYLKALPFYDLLAVVRTENFREAERYGARKVVRVWMSADEIAHRPRQLTENEFARWMSDVCFIGTWMPERGPFMAALIEAGLPLSIWGDNWQKAPEWRVIAPYWRGPAQSDPEIYCRIVQAAKICLGLLSKGNRDRHTTRSLEIPSLGGLLCAERTDEHLELYEDGKEAVFWDDVGECIELCRTLLLDQPRIAAIKAAALIRAQKNGIFNEAVLENILSTIPNRFPIDEAERH